MSDTSGDRQQLIDLMEDMWVAMFTTIADDGTLQAVPMARRPADAGGLPDGRPPRQAAGVTTVSNGAWLGVSYAARLEAVVETFHSKTV